MDDLTGLDWSSKPAAGSAANNPSSHLKATPSYLTPVSSGRSTPLSALNDSSAQQPKLASKPATPAHDSFSNLLSLNSSKPATASLSLQERQRQLLEEKARQQAAQLQKQEEQNKTDARFWDSLGGPQPSTSSGLAHLPPAPSLATRGPNPFKNTAPENRSPVEADLLAAFRADATVDASSHFPPPQNNFSNNDDDDPFGLGTLPQRSSNAVSPAPAAIPAAADDDDILGMLGKPVSELPPQRSPPASNTASKQPVASRNPSPKRAPMDRAVADLVDMGFPADKAAQALAQTESGRDVQAAVSLLLNQAHQEAAQKAKISRQPRERPRYDDDDNDDDELDGDYYRPDPRSMSQRKGDRHASPAWMQEQSSRSGSRHRGEESSSRGDKDVSQYASDIGSSLFKSANSLWKTSQKKVQRAMADFQQESDPSQPKWMRSTQPEPGASRSRQLASASNMTDEAMMLESGGGARPGKHSEMQNAPRNSSPLPRPQERRPEFGQLPQRQASPAWTQQSRSSSAGLEKSQASRLSRQEVEAQSAHAYVSPARRKKTTPTPPVEQPQSIQKPSSSARSSPAAQLHPNNPFAKPSSPAPAPARATPTVSARSTPPPPPPPPRPKAPPRQVPQVSATALSTSAGHRQQGGEAFKRGDYAAAQTSYSAALSQIPDAHPITIIILCNRALTNIKVGDPKAAVIDADAAIKAIGPSKGLGEKIALGGADGEKEMREFYGKALMRKAEALENMEKWSDALNEWKEAVSAGLGGSVSMQGRTRCEQAVGKARQAAAPVKKPAAKPKPAPARSALQDLGGGPAIDSEAVKRMKAANAAAEQADNEKFALTDQVDAKLTDWRGTKSDNLRALLGSLDKVLWPEAGWNKVNMSDLVMPNRVKIVYMKAIAKVHPDKLSQTATTEQKMISAAVFSTLNEAWDKFKKDNNL